jgi:hypothetical protein
MAGLGAAFFLFPWADDDEAAHCPVFVSAPLPRATLRSPPLLCALSAAPLRCEVEAPPLPPCRLTSAPTC